jgi:hypothetical protein
VRGGTATLLTLFRPAPGAVRAKGVTSASNAVLHPWLRDELSAILEELAPTTSCDPAAPFLPSWWQRRPKVAERDPAPPGRLILIWENLAGHTTPALGQWRCHQGLLPLYTPLSGSGLNLAEALQRLVVRRALDGQHPQTAAEVIPWLEDTLAGGNAEPTPFVWAGKRRERRQRARQRRRGEAAAAVDQSQLFAA